MIRIKLNGIIMTVPKSDIQHYLDAGYKVIDPAKPDKKESVPEKAETKEKEDTTKKSGKTSQTSKK